ncbi:N6-adenine methyltransferase [Yasminevirus sp. GU-2018]|uniref:N6-adenine methyltransferase n=1 Tax=Yasminevirus sp. GU-2018 TaxID=2420051 RepID=A0A5K0U987_9VIRU|nr:N6-adenine methyltransferase [Yasminevirus sp. GU-2018]
MSSKTKTSTRTGSNSNSGKGVSLDDEFKNEFLIDADTGALPIPRNMFIKQEGNVFKDEIEEQHAWEQFFWTKNVVDRLMKACEYTYVEETCCLTTPSLAHSWHEQGRDEILLDIDKRFSYLPKFKYYDMRNPKDVDGSFRLLVLDPPFFLIPIEQVRKAVDVITKNNYDTKIIIAFLKRTERRLLEAFKEYNIRLTNFELQYASIKQNKWGNFGLYSNIDLPGIKRIS